MDIKVFANFRDICGGKKVTLHIEEGQSIHSVLDDLTTEFPPMKEELFTDKKELKPMIHVFINGRNIIHLDGLETKLKVTDEVALFPPVAGG
ncbi:molybdopterin synthase sulfur carrier subunit [Evansella vedderi]|uniref:Molybdopterin synthase sulfur carrier subunit n=1 Tax=Evansella vedderi TaxID=38282 RepID=A0ABT9ZYN8_9BACI|nr:ubiquitin-like small modifier protein 1 [Evansella vedderi]MDQ0255852.1 molybdopterin synthase sulfur carrier subunit [Evansella vedderi]